MRLLESFCSFERLFFLCCSLISSQFKRNNGDFHFSFLLRVKSHDMIYEFTFVADFAVFPLIFRSLSASKCPLGVDYSLTLLDQCRTTLRRCCVGKTVGFRLRECVLAAARTVNKEHVCVCDLSLDCSLASCPSSLQVSLF